MNTKVKQANYKLWIILVLICVLALSWLVSFLTFNREKVFADGNKVVPGNFNAVNVTWEYDADDTSVGSFVEFQGESTVDLTGFTYIAIRLKVNALGSKGSNKVFRTILIDENGVSLQGEHYAFGTTSNTVHGYYPVGQYATADLMNFTSMTSATQYFNHMGAELGFDGWMIIPSDWLCRSFSSTYPKETTMTSIDYTKIRGFAIGRSDAGNLGGMNLDVGEIRVYYNEIDPSTGLSGFSYQNLFTPKADGSVTNVGTSSSCTNTDRYTLTGKIVSFEGTEVDGRFEGVNAVWSEETLIDNNSDQQVMLYNTQNASLTGATYIAIRAYHRSSIKSNVLRPVLFSENTNYYMISRPVDGYDGYENELALLYNSTLTNYTTAQGYQYYQHVGAKVGWNGWLMIPLSAYDTVPAAVEGIKLGARMRDADMTGCGQNWDFGEVRIYYGDVAEGNYQVFCNPVKEDGMIDGTSFSCDSCAISVNKSKESFIGNEYATREGVFDGLNFDLCMGDIPESSQWFFVDYRNGDYLDFSDFSYLALRVKNNIHKRMDFSADGFQFWLYDENNERRGLSFTSRNLLQSEQRCYVYTSDWRYKGEIYTGAGIFVLEYDFDGWLIVPRTAIENADELDLRRISHIRLYANKKDSSYVNLDMGDLLLFNEDVSVDSLADCYVNEKYQTVLSPTFGLKENELSEYIAASALFDGVQGKISRVIEQESKYKISSMASLVPTGNTKVRLLEKNEVSGTTMVEKSYFRDIYYIMDGAMPGELIGKSYLFDDFSGSTATVETAGQIVLIFPDTLAYSSLRSRLDEESGRYVESRAVSSYGDYKSCIYILDVQAGETVDYGEGVIVVFGTLADFDDYYDPITDGQMILYTDENQMSVEMLPESRTFICASTIIKTKGGRLFSMFGTGGITEPDNENYAAVVYSDDDGKTWIDPFIVFDSDCVEVNTVGESLHYLPDGRVLMCVYSGIGCIRPEDKGICAWGAYINNPDADTVEGMDISEPFKIFADDYKYSGHPGKNIIQLSSGELLWWLEQWDGYYQNRPNLKVDVYASEDNGSTWTLRGTATMQNPYHTCLEASIVELSDGTLWMTSRIEKNANGMEECYSYDRGRTWVDYKDGLDAPLQTPGSRFWMSKLSSGNLILIVNANLQTRSDLTIYLSTDDGKTWPYSYYIEKHFELTSPVAFEDESGLIYISYDRGRLSNLEVRGIKLREEDIIAGKLISEDAERFLIVKYSQYFDIVKVQDSTSHNEMERYYNFAEGTEASEIIASFPDSLLLTNDKGQTATVTGSYTMEEGYNGALGTYILKFVPESLPTNWTDFTGAYDLREKLSFRIRILNECMISFESNGGESIAPLTVLAGGTVTEPAAPEREDYQFEGWYKDADFAERYDFTEPVTDDITLYAKWTKIVTVSFESNGGESIAPLTVLAGGTVTEPTAPEREGYRFEGWYKDADFAERYDFTEPVTDDITLYAKWVQNTETDHGGCAGSGIGTKGMIAPVSLLVAFTFIIFKKGKKA